MTLHVPLCHVMTCRILTAKVNIRPVGKFVVAAATLHMISGCFSLYLSLEKTHLIVKSNETMNFCVYKGDWLQQHSCVGDRQEGLC